MIRKLWNAYRRRFDILILWPSCKEVARERGLHIDHARGAFAMHAFNDRAWMVLGREEVIRRIDALK